MKPIGRDPRDTRPGRQLLRPSSQRGHRRTRGVGHLWADLDRDEEPPLQMHPARYLDCFTVNVSPAIVTFPFLVPARPL